jgi:acyl-CoA thioesterase-2
VGDLGVDTSVRQVDAGRYVADLSDEWEIWGPMGGYVAAFALRAAGAASPFARPASLFCHYLGVGRFDAIDLTVTTLRSARTACSQRVVMTQGDRPIMEATVWSVGDVEGLEHDVAIAPDVPDPGDLQSAAERWPDMPPPFPFWNNLDSRNTEWEEDWPPQGPLAPVWRSWCKFVPRATFEDPWVDAARATILIDVQSWPSAHRHHAWKEPAFIAPSLDLYVAFHQVASDSDWLLADGFSPAAADGLIGWTGRLWSERRQLVASGGGQALCRRVP